MKNKALFSHTRKHERYRLFADVQQSGVLELKRLTCVGRVARAVHIVRSVTLTYLYNPRPTPLCSSQSNFLN